MALDSRCTVHGLRSTITDLLNEQGFNPDAGERQVDHFSKDRVRAAYLRRDFFDYRRRMMQWLADWADAQQANRPAPPMPDNVVLLRQSQ